MKGKHKGQKKWQTLLHDYLPISWRVERVKSIASKIGSGITPKGGAVTYQDNGIPLLRSQNIHFDSIRLDDVAYITQETHDMMSNSKVYTGDVLLNITGASIGRCSYAHSEVKEANVNQHVCIIRPCNKVVTKYLCYFLSSPLGQEQIFSSFTGSSREGLSIREIGQFRLIIPLPNEQRAIAAYLDKTCAAIDKAIEAKQNQLGILDALHKSIITKAVTRGLDKKAKRKDSGHIWIGRIPQEWKVEKLKYVTDLIVDGTHFTPDYIEEGVPFLRVTDIQNSQIDQNKVKRISEGAHRELCKRANPKAGDILLSKNGTIGLIKVVEWNWEFSIFVSLCLIRLRKFLSPYFFRYYFESDVVDQQLFESSKRTSVTNLHLVKIREMRIAFPQLDEQQTIVTFLDNKCAELDKLKDNIQQQISTLEQYRKSLIHECVTSKRRITEDDVQNQL